jgi:hypothetical protein
MNTALGVRLLQQVAVLGASTSAASAAHIELLPIQTQSQSWQGTVLKTAMALPFCADSGRDDRLMQLLMQLQARLNNSADRKIVYLLLPEFTGADNPELDNLLQAIMRQWPALLQSELCRIFPYGCAGSMMAFHAAQQQLQVTPTQTVWLLAVDSLCYSAMFTQMAAAASDWLLSEGAIALCLGAERGGISAEFTGFDAVTTPQNDDVIGCLFAQVAAAGQRLQQIYMPDCGDLRLTGRWLAQYHRLSGVIDQQTEYKLPSYFTGELGTVGGLYRLMHILLGYQQGRLRQRTMQYELSERLYRSVAVYAQR